MLVNHAGSVGWLAGWRCGWPVALRRGWRASAPAGSGGHVVLLNRYAERAALGRLLDAARAGQSGVLVVRGVPGIGKTALLEDAIESATGFRVARIVGVESEMELAFAALQQLCGPMLDRADRLSAPQPDALGGC